MNINNYLSYRNDVLYSNGLRSLGLKHVFYLWFKKYIMSNKFKFIISFAIGALVACCVIALA